MSVFYYPKNLKAGAMIWYWSVKDFVILGVTLFAAIVLAALTSSVYLLCIPMVWAVLSIRLEEGTIREVLQSATCFFLTGQQKFLWKGGSSMRLRKNNTVRQQLGIRGFGHYGLQTERGELLLFTIAPANISVLSENATLGRVAEFARLLEAFPDLEVSITDASESFDSNRVFLHGRLHREKNPAVRRLLEKDIAFLDTIQIEMATARLFMLIVRTGAKKETEIFRIASDAERRIAAQGFQVHRMRKDEIKRMLALYLDAGLEGDRFPDVEGAQYMKAAP